MKTAVNTTGIPTSIAEAGELQALLSVYPINVVTNPAGTKTISHNK